MWRYLKIILLILSVFPLWLTIVAMGQTSDSRDFHAKEQWKQKINSELLGLTDRKIQIVEIVSSPVQFDELFLDQKPILDLSGVKPSGVSSLFLQYRDEQGRLLKRIRFFVRVFIEDSVVVASHALKAGTLMSEDDYVLAWKDAGQLSGVPARNTDFQGYEIRSSVKRGDVIYKENLVSEKLVHRGDSVQVILSTFGIRLSTSGIAAQEGHRGDTIKVLNSDSKKEITGVVVGKRQVEVQL